jgi:hypothetical protein
MLLVQLSFQLLRYHVQGSKGKNLATPLFCLAKMDRLLDCNEIGRRCLSGAQAA